MKISVLPRDNDRNATQIETTWSGLVDWITKAPPREVYVKGDAPLWSNIIWEKWANKANARSVSPLLIVDIDKTAWSRVLAWYEQTRYSLIYHTSFSYRTPEDPEELARVRFILPLSRECSVLEWDLLWPKLIEHIGLTGMVDTYCRDLARAYFVPVIMPGMPYVSGSKEGETIDVDAASRLTVSAPLSALDVSGEGLDVPLDLLEDLVKKLRRAKNGERKILGHMLGHVCKGEPFAKEGGRDNAIFRLACLIAEEFPTGSPSSLANHFITSLSSMGDNAPTVATVEEKIARKQREVAATRGSHNQELVKRITQAFGYGRCTPYTQEELTNFTRRDSMDHRWVLTDGTSAFFFLAGDYVESKIAVLDVAARTYLAPAITAGVDLTYVSPDGLREKTSSQILRDYGSILRGIDYDLSAETTFYDRERHTLICCGAQRREILPKYHPDVAQWLEIMCGEQLPHVLDWLATVRNLSSPGPALLMFGASGAGKNLLAQGVARLWSERGPTDLNAVAGSFHDALLSCPLVFGDESIPRNSRGVPDTEMIRKIITQDSFSMNRKFKAEARLVGAIRLVLGVQRLETVFSEADLSEDDIKAIADRFIVVSVTEASRGHLKSLGGSLTTERWVAGDAIAEHVVWLEKNHVASRGDRLIVQGNAGDLVKYLQVSSGVRWGIAQWLYEFLRNPGTHVMRAGTGTGGGPAAFVSGCELFVSGSRLAACWDHYLASQRTPSTERLGKACRDLCYGDVVSKQGRAFRRFELRHLYDWTRISGELPTVVDRVINGEFEAVENAAKNLN